MIFIVAAVVFVLLVVWVWWRRHPRQARHQNGSHEQRVLQTTDAFATWDELDRATQQQGIRFTVPANSPFSYEGGAVSRAWHVAVRDRHAHGLDASRDVPIWVSP